MQFSTNIKGIKELDQLLQTLPQNLQRRAIKSGIVAMGRHFVLEMRKRAPEQSGGLKKSIKNRSGGRTRQNVVIEAPHWHLVEFGTTQRFHNSGKPTGRVSGTKFSFVRPTLFTESKPASNNFEIKLRAAIERESKKLLR